jgi:adenylylsulfate kinase-like enzyme
MSKMCRKPKCSNPALPGKKLCAYHKAERDAKVTRAIAKAAKIAKEVGPLVLTILISIFTKGKVKPRPKRFG